MCSICESKMVVGDRCGRELDCDGLCGRRIRRVERRASCVLCDFDLCMECAGGDEALMVRRPGYDQVYGHNELVYAADVWIGGVRMAGLFARRKINAGTIIGEYMGAVMSRRRAARADMSNNQYLMDARRVGGAGEMVVIDGRPTEGAGNLMGFANYVVDAHANAAFRDDAARAPAGKTTFVRVYAKATIEEGQEIRVDYDMGDAQRRSFYTYLTEVVGVPAAGLGSGEYKADIWATPKSLRGGVGSEPQRAGS